MNPSTELRKLAPSSVRELVHILEDADSWKKLMEIIPKRLEKEDYECNFSEDNPQKYHSDHFRLIERASRNYQRPCSEILLDEWGTSGRVRPSLGHFLHLLKKAEMYRAADFVAVNLLKATKPQRPREGPAAHVHVTFLLDDNRDEIEEVLENVRCDSSDIRNLGSSPNTVENNIEVNLPAHRKVVQLANPIDREVSDMMEFSHSVEDNEAEEADDEGPNISALLRSRASNIPQDSEDGADDDASLRSQALNIPRNKAGDDVPNISALLHSQDSNIPQNIDNDVPKISALLHSRASNIPQNIDDGVPNISALLRSRALDIPRNVEDDQVSQEEGCFVPQISALLASKTDTFENADLPQISKLLLISALLSAKNSNVQNTTNQDDLPQISQLLQNENSTLLPQLSALLTPKTNDAQVPEMSALLNSLCVPQNQSQNEFLPQISALLSTNEDDTLKSQLNSVSTSQNEFLPQISALLSANEEGSYSSLLPQQIKELLLSKRIDQYTLVPQLSALLSSSEGIGLEINKLLSPLPDDQKDALLKSLLPQAQVTSKSDNVENSDYFSGPQISKLLNAANEFTPQESDAAPKLKSDNSVGGEESAPQISKLLQPAVDSGDQTPVSSDTPVLTHQNDSLTSGDSVPQITDLSESPQQNGVRQRISSYESISKNHSSNIPADARNNPPFGNNSLTQRKSSLLDKPRSNSLTPQISISSSTGPQTPTTSLLSPNVDTTSNELSSPNSSSSGRPQCNSPLPNLSLNTILPHFNYQELELATSSFDETPHPRGRFLGSGAFGSVFLCLGLLEKPTAVKKLHLDGATEVNVNDAITKQFRNEVELLCSYKHDNLLSICGYSCDGPTYCIMYEYISGGALNYRLENHRAELNWRDRMRIACGTAEAVAYLHTAYSRQLIHRDIKTANILLDSANKPKLGDFGIIKLSPNKNTTVTTTIIGTSVYMAPECFRSGEVTEKTDTFSFGVVLLELLTALPPLDENREARDIITHVEDMCDNDSIAPLLDLSAGSWMKGDTNVAEELFTVANRCLGEKRHRPNMVEVTDLLNRLVSN